MVNYWHTRKAPTSISQNGTELNRIKLVTPFGCCTDLAFSPDAKHLRFTARDEGSSTVGIWEVGIDGKGMHSTPARQLSSGSG